jgi:hypothetical protein
MNPTATVEAVPERVAPAERTAGGWLVWVALVSTTSIMFGIYWDISWHMSIGRDTFWTPAHLCIQFGGILSALCSAVVIFSTTFGKDAARKAASISVWGFRGPLGAFISAWGGVAMATSAPFDDWWHNAYGLDVKIISPPHMVLDFGILGVTSGGLLLILSAMNRAGPEQRRTYERVFLFVASELLVLAMIAIWERSFRVQLHLAQAYRSVAALTPPLLLAVSRATHVRWATTRITAFYSGLLLLGLWVTPLFPAEPKLGPVYQSVTHLVPLEFPLLLIVPALVLDLLRPRLEGRKLWVQALVIGPLFVASFTAVQWPFADFLLSKASANWVFGTHYVPYFIPPWFHAVQRTFVPEIASTTIIGLGIAVIDAILSSAVGLFAGAVARKVRR